MLESYYILINIIAFLIFILICIIGTNLVNKYYKKHKLKNNKLQIYSDSINIKVFNERNIINFNPSDFIIIEPNTIILNTSIQKEVYKELLTKKYNNQWLINIFHNIKTLLLPYNEIPKNKLIISELSLYINDDNNIYSIPIITGLNIDEYLYNIVDNFKTYLLLGKSNFIIKCAANDYSFDLLVSISADLFNYLKENIQNINLIDTEIQKKSNITAFRYTKNSKILLTSPIYVQNFIEKHIY